MSKDDKMREKARKDAGVERARSAAAAARAAVHADRILTMRKEADRQRKQGK